MPNTPKAKSAPKPLDPILSAAEADGIQWQTTALTGIEVLLPVKLEQGHFEVKRDTYTPKVTSTDTNGTNETESDSGTLYFDRGLTYRLRMDRSTHGYGFMIGRKPEDSQKRFDQRYTTQWERSWRHSNRASRKEDCLRRSAERIESQQRERDQDSRRADRQKTKLGISQEIGECRPYSRRVRIGNSRKILPFQSVLLLPRPKRRRRIHTRNGCQ